MKVWIIYIKWALKFLRKINGFRERNKEIDIHKTSRSDGYVWDFTHWFLKFLKVNTHSIKLVSDYINVQIPQ